MINESGRILSVDPGTKRTGLAVSDELGITAQGLETFVAGKDMKLVAHIADLVEKYGIIRVVLGMPLSMSGGEIEGTERSRALAAEIEAECGVEVVLRDERMTSLEVERVMKQEGRIKDPGDIDRLSAVVLLQSYLEETGS
ncbi:MAG TPA: Holliday junction resolvase RuvX [Candidatus Krumholzibacterium sp.]|nr:Holliday junction resolvase RuvX [Candidatus Krumholzibacterium sp.]